MARRPRQRYPTTEPAIVRSVTQGLRPDVPWRKGTILFYRGWTVVGEEQNGRSYWAVKSPTGFHAEETGDLGHAFDFIDGKEEGDKLDIFLYGSQ